MKIEVRGLNIGTTPAIEGHARKRLRFALGRFSGELRTVGVRFEDVNGPRGGPDQLCRMVARLRPARTLRVEALAEDLYHAIDQAAGRLGRAVGRELDRRRSARRSLVLRPAWGLRS